MKSVRFIHIHPADNTAVALKPMDRGTSADTGTIRVTLSEDIKQGHKFAVSNIPKGDRILKYGSPIGTASEDIPAGSWVHTHNMKTELTAEGTYAYTPENHQLQTVPPSSFSGFYREDGRAGTRNEIWIIPTVGCVNSLAKRIENMSQKYVSSSIDAVAAFPHPYGCSQTGEDQENTRRILSSLIRHPNAGGVLVLGLGCENTGIETLKKYIGEYDRNRVRFLNAQDCADETEEALSAVEMLAEYAGRSEREPLSTSKLIVGLKCGGSDGLSGITANPLVGAFTDRHIASGGSAVLTEVPEMFGAETILMNRCADYSVFEKTVEMINGFKRYYTGLGQPVYENPSPGNLEGGITTLEDKSLGCIQKAGSAQVSDVIGYGDSVSDRGLTLLSAPGNDLVSTTALAAAGAQIILFTTGRGTPFGAPVPTVKISSNTNLFERKRNWIDFDAGVIADGADMNDTAYALYSFIIKAASGERVKSESAGFRDIAIFKSGVTL